MKYLLSIFIFVLLFAPGAVVFGAEGLVTCDGVTVNGEGVSCNFCKFASMMDNVIDFIVGILILISVIMLAVTGIQMAYTAAGSGDARALLKDRLTNIVIGFILILAAWTLVDVLIKALVVDDEIKNWRAFVMTDTSKLCAGQFTPVANIANDPDSEATSYTPTTPVTPTNNLVEFSGARFDSAIVNNVQHMSETLGLTVSGGHRTVKRNEEVNGSPTSYHLSGRAADFTGSTAQMKAGKAWAEANGAREVLIHDAGSGTHLHVAW